MKTISRPLRPRGPVVGAKSTPARDMTHDQAIDWLEERESIVLLEGGRVSLPAVLSGVILDYCDPSGCHEADARNIDPRFGVYLVRLARMLRERFGATRIRHYGIWPAGKGQPSHDAGIAIDLAAVVTGAGVFSVFADWGNRPKLSSGGFRLQPSDRGFELFRAIYQFTGEQGDDRWNGTASEIGVEDTFIRHPDLLNAQAAHLHRDHLHLQAGQVKTGVGVVPITPHPKPEEGGAPPAPAASSSSSSSSSVGTFLLGATITGAVGAGVAWYLRSKFSGGGATGAPAT